MGCDQFLCTRQNKKIAQSQTVTVPIHPTIKQATNLTTKINKERIFSLPTNSQGKNYQNPTQKLTQNLNYSENSNERRFFFFI